MLILTKKENDNGYKIKVTNVGVIAATLKHQIQRLELFFEIDERHNNFLWCVNDMIKASKKIRNDEMHRTNIII